MKKGYWFNVGVAVDQLINALCQGWPDETLSARCWREKRWQRYIIDKIFFLQYKDGKGHCEQSYIYEMERKDLPGEYRL